MLRLCLKLPSGSEDGVLDRQMETIGDLSHVIPRMALVKKCVRSESSQLHLIYLLLLLIEVVFGDVHFKRRHDSFLL